MLIKRSFLTVFCFCFLLSTAFADSGANDILGQWMSVGRNVKVQVYKEGDEFKARVTWFNDSDDKSQPMNTRTDEHNPDLKLRQRKILGMQVLSRLRYSPKNKRWENGRIYDPKTGKQWSSVVYLTEEGLLSVKGFWQFEFIGKTMKFNKVI